ncbi:GtrA family protein [Pseudomonas frederiksbergensis]|uniref:Membrane protein n=1 Tax=Pseudomonas frederiksbergensis TaxID=104087 RepID=A0A0B1Z9A2_9PSED|nr:GtrA family protein [Pseudomonas frederiksbergensis]KHK65796.1 membrane protein [Pseudomonas frederiksbergensis]
MSPIKWQDIKFVRFLLTGGINTIATYCLYLALLNLLPYIWSYSISYVSGIFLAFFLNRFFVFKEHQGLKTVLLLPMIYVAQYAIGVLIVWLWVMTLELPEFLAPLAATLILIPFTYVLSKLIFVKPKTLSP